MQRALDIEEESYYDLDADYIIYDSGADALDFTERYLATSLNSRPLTWVEKLAMTCNDALNDHSLAWGIDGYFLVSRCATAPAPFKSDRSILCKLGPQLIFAQSVRSSKERQQWKQASVLEKLHMSSLYWKLQSISDQHPVLPIWTTDPYRQPESEEFSAFTTATKLRGFTAFPTSDLLENQKISDPTVDASGKVRGPICDILEGKIMLVGAEEYRHRCQKDYLTGLQRLSIKYQGKILSHGRWALKHKLEGEDQIEAFIRAIADWTKRSPGDMIRYSEARTWAPVALFHETVDPEKSHLPRSEERATRVEEAADNSGTAPTETSTRLGRSTRSTRSTTSTRPAMSEED